MNKKGQVLIFGIMLMVLSLILVTILGAPIREFVDISRDADHLNCSSNTLSTGTLATCLVIDLFLPYFVGAALFLGGSFLIYRSAASSGMI